MRGSGWTLTHAELSLSDLALLHYILITETYSLGVRTPKNGKSMYGHITPGSYVRRSRGGHELDELRAELELSNR